MTLFSALDIARGWRSVAIASAVDKDRPALHRTISIEAFSDGLRLVATDSYVLLRSWVPNIDHPFAPEPDLDEAPYATAVAMDPHRRALGFFGHVARLAAVAEKDEMPSPEIRVSLGVVDEVDETDRPSFAGMEALWCLVELPDAERIKLRAYEGEYPAWRKVETGFRPVTASTIALNPDIVGRLSKLGKVQAGGLLGFTWGGEHGAARFDLIHAEPEVTGFVMPCRWDFDRDEPRPEGRDELDEEEAEDEGDQDDESLAPPMPYGLALTDSQRAGLALIREHGGLHASGRTDPEAGIIHHSTAEALARLDLVETDKTHMPGDDVRPFFFLTALGRVYLDGLDR